ncbi:Nuclear and cytoplasmic polyadenylated RNA-binding protein PUB1 [Wickerhamomyces ciferrii]|uniref:Nuclear and cytoplasmic polyadenylated RNA-binding protein PUB1 n=1 Tax=Wickerhamomyces ciferrii (strain ATCC 14091 / BCRC 22168 / CBS 111 / JCM 3599 / NBRC 0793 / NRRL Y-1031 F-60-10) TaxID=1206466 RepID=K0KGE9_WICCF|nr:Nuclear and cytoplasmic polyadenylated RNA-binding protein PUB1 [Wickerhamomyces ciferrii]CCH42041.1 Nuclear and cytoplasmic polyadenylated RNA-binding protein PUB1 [Wickerhamomyces ciferrii]
MTTEEHEQVVDQQQQQNDTQNEVQKDVKEDLLKNEVSGDSNGEDETSESIKDTKQNEQQNGDSSNEHNGEQNSEQSHQQQQQQQPEVQPALATQGGREVSNKILYVGGLDKTISEDQLREIFSQHGEIDNVKILFDKNKQNFNYAFIEFQNELNASNAFQELNNKTLQNSVISINWAYQSQQAKNSSEHFNIFVGDLSTEIDDEQLKAAFNEYKSLVQAHVMWDMQSGRSRGYGFVSFTNQQDAELALTTKQGSQIGNRQVRLNWASHKQHNNHGHNGHHNHHHNNHHNGHHHRNNGYNHRGHHNGHHNHHLNGYQTNGLHSTNGFTNINPNGLINGSTSLTGTTTSGAPGAPTPLTITPAGAVPTVATGLNIVSPQSYDLVLRKTPSWLTTVYLGNLTPYTTQNDLIPLVQNFGYIVDLKFHQEKNCAFIKYDSHERAALAIVQLSGLIINGRPLKTGWGKDRINHNVQYQNYGPVIYQGR